MAVLKTNEQYLADVAAVNPNIDVLEDYVNGRTHIHCRCRVCGHEWWPLAGAIQYKKNPTGCPKCGQKNRVLPARMTQEEFEQKVKKLRPSITVIGSYTKSSNRVQVRCDICGYVWWPVAGTLTSKGNHVGCKKCSNKKLSNLLIKDDNWFRDKLAKDNGGVLLVGHYTGSNKRVRVACKNCGYEWEPLACSLIGKKTSGCPECYRRNQGAVLRKRQEQYVLDVALVNPNITVVGDYRGSTEKILVRCDICGYEWEPLATSICRQSQTTGCPNCAGKKPIAWFIEQYTGEGFPCVVTNANPDKDGSIEVMCKKRAHVFRTWAPLLYKKKLCVECNRIDAEE